MCWKHQVEQFPSKTRKQHSYSYLPPPESAAQHVEVGLQAETLQNYKTSSCYQSVLAAWPQVVQYHAISTTPFNLTSTLRTLSVYVCFCPAPKLSKQKFFQVTLGWRPATKVRFELHMPQAVEVLGFTKTLQRDACIHAKDCSWCRRSGRSKPVGISACPDWVSSVVNEKTKKKSLRSLNIFQHVSTWSILLLTFSKIVELLGLLEKVVLVLLVILELLCVQPFSVHLAQSCLNLSFT